MKNFGKLTISTNKLLKNDELMNIKGGLLGAKDKCNSGCSSNADCDTGCPNCLPNAGWGSFCYKSPGL
jgi:hypothetical protein